MHPSIRGQILVSDLFLIFPANSQILHPSIEISNQGTVKELAIIDIQASAGALETTPKQLQFTAHI